MKLIPRSKLSLKVAPDALGLTNIIPKSYDRIKEERGDIVNLDVGGNASIGNTTSDKIGLYGVTPIAQPSAYTQTYSTSNKTHDARTAATIGDLTATSGGWGASSEVDFDKISDTIDKLVADQQNTAQLVNALIDDMQALGAVG